MKFYFTGIQHQHNGNEVVIPTVAYSTKDEYLAKYHQEMNYAMSAPDILDGLSVIVFDSTGVIILQDHWMRTVDGVEIPIEPIEETA